MTIKNQKSKIKNPRAFTLVELLVVIGIIGVLVAILIPVIGKVRTQSHVADTKNSLNQLVSAIERYHNDFHAYPGPASNDQIRSATMSAAIADAGGDTQWETATPYFDKMTGTENLVLGLLGGLRIQGNQIVYDPRNVGKGPINLNPANPKRYEPYADLKDTSMHVNAAGRQTGAYTDGSVEADDSIIPEFVDRFPEPMPLLYMRPRVGAARPNITTPAANVDNGIVNAPGATAAVKQIHQYDLDQIIGYTGVFSTTSVRGSMTLQTGNFPAGICIGQGKDLNGKMMDGTNAKEQAPIHGLRNVDVNRTMAQGTASYIYPFDAYSYLQNPANKNTPRSKDTFVLIAAGADRIYGTEDDITSFGDVK
jgi:prepilin-type N-terminal cleavage/methylation domain-containing protein